MLPATSTVRRSVVPIVEPIRRERRHRWHRGTMVLITVVAGASMRSVASTAVAVCVGDCSGDNVITVEEIVTGVNISLGILPLTACPAFDSGGDGTVTVEEVIQAVNAALTGCVPLEPTAIATPTTTSAATGTPTGTATRTATPTPEVSVMPVATIAARNTDGIAVLLNQTVITEGVVTASAGLFANNKLKIFIQDGDAGVMVFHQTSANVPAFQIGDRLRVSGVVRQADPTVSSNAATGTVLVDITSGSYRILSTGNQLPAPAPVTLETLATQGVPFVGTLITVARVHKVSGTWPPYPSQSTQVSIGNEAGTASLVLRLQRFTITAALSSELNAIGNGPFDLIGIAVQDDTDGNGTRLSGLEIWERGADDVQAAQ